MLHASNVENSAGMGNNLLKFIVITVNYFSIGILGGWGPK